MADQPVSRHMRREFTTLRGDLSAAAALESLRLSLPAERIVYFYVVDAAGHLCGVVPTRRLLIAPAEARLTDIMVRDVITIPQGMSVASACEFFVMHRLLAFPVVDDENRIVGVVDVSLLTDEVFELTERKAADDLFQLIGVHLQAGKPASVWRSYAGRFPWLLCNIAGGMICAGLSAMYERFLDLAIVLAFFVPMVLSLAESVSIQAMTLTLQAMHAGAESGTQAARVGAALRHEALTAVMLGGSSGAIVGFAAWLWRGDTAVSIAIGLSVLGAIVTACLLGAILPRLVRVLQVDPKIAAGPIVLAAADTATLALYFSLGAWALNATARG